MNILIIDDCEAIVDYIKESLSSKNIVVYGALNGRDGMTIAVNKNIDIAFIDILLPDMTGIEVYNHLSKIKDMKAVAITGNRESFKNTYKEYGFLDLLEKPFEASELRNLIKKYFPKK